MRSLILILTMTVSVCDCEVMCDPLENNERGASIQLTKQYIDPSRHGYYDSSPGSRRSSLRRVPSACPRRGAPRATVAAAPAAASALGRRRPSSGAAKQARGVALDAHDELLEPQRHVLPGARGGAASVACA